MNVKTPPQTYFSVRVCFFKCVLCLHLHSVICILYVFLVQYRMHVSHILCLPICLDCCCCCVCWLGENLLLIVLCVCLYRLVICIWWYIFIYIVRGGALRVDWFCRLPRCPSSGFRTQKPTTTTPKHAPIRAALLLELVVLGGHIDGPSEFVTLRLVVDLVDGHVVFLAPGDLRKTGGGGHCKRLRRKEYDTAFHSNSPGHRDSRIQIVQLGRAERNSLVLIAIGLLQLHLFQLLFGALQLLLLLVGDHLLLDRAVFGGFHGVL